MASLQTPKFGTITPIEQFIIGEVMQIHSTISKLESLRPSKNVNALFSRLVNICTLPSSIDINALPQEIQKMRESLIKLCGNAEGLLELEYATTLIKTQNPLANLTQFPYYGNYIKLTSLEHKILTENGVVRPKKVAFIGSGPMPLTSIILATCHFKSSHFDNYDIDEAANEVARRIVGSDSELEKRMKFMTCDVMDLKEELGEYDCVFLAALVGRSQAEKMKIVRHLIKYMKNGRYLLLRSANGARAFLYPVVEPHADLIGFGLLSIFHPTDDVINSVVLARIKMVKNNNKKKPITFIPMDEFKVDEFKAISPNRSLRKSSSEKLVYKGKTPITEPPRPTKKKVGPSEILDRSTKKQKTEETPKEGSEVVITFPKDLSTLDEIPRVFEAFKRLYSPKDHLSLENNGVNSILQEMGHNAARMILSTIFLEGSHNKLIYDNSSLKRKIHIKEQIITILQTERVTWMNIAKGLEDENVSLKTKVQELEDEMKETKDNLKLAYQDVRKVGMGGMFRGRAHCLLEYFAGEIQHWDWKKALQEYKKMYPNEPLDDEENLVAKCKVRDRASTSVLSTVHEEAIIIPINSSKTITIETVNNLDVPNVTGVMPDMLHKGDKEKETDGTIGDDVD